MSNTLLERLRTKAASLTNGHKGDMATLCAVVADMAAVVADVAENGCAAKCKQFSWPAAAAVLGSVGMVVGLALALAR